MDNNDLVLEETILKENAIMIFILIITLYMITEFYNHFRKSFINSSNSNELSILILPIIKDIFEIGSLISFLGIIIIILYLFKEITVRNSIYINNSEVIISIILFFIPFKRKKYNKNDFQLSLFYKKEKI